MKPLMTFGSSNEFGLSLNKDGLIVFHQINSGESDPIYPEMLDEIHRHGGYQACREMLYSLVAVAPAEVPPPAKESPPAPPAKSGKAKPGKK